jgi:hypothetical protein
VSTQNSAKSCVNFSAIWQLRQASDPFEEQAKTEKQDPPTHSLGLWRMDLIEVPPQVDVLLLTWVKGSREHHDGENRHRKEV